MRQVNSHENEIRQKNNIDKRRQVDVTIVQSLLKQFKHTVIWTRHRRMLFTSYEIITPVIWKELQNKTTSSLEKIGIPQQTIL